MKKLLILLSVVVSGCSSVDMLKPNPLPANLKTLTQGQALYTKHCVSCHGSEGRAQIDFPQWQVGPANLQELPTFPPGFIEVAIRDGGDTPNMPAWKDILTQNEIYKIGRYIRSELVKTN